MMEFKDPHAHGTHIPRRGYEDVLSTFVTMGNDLHGMGVIQVRGDRQYRVTVLAEDIEDHKYGGPFPRSRWFSCPRRAYIAYAMAVIRHSGYEAQP